MAPDLHVVSRGPTSGLTLLLIHPLGSSHVFWDECAAIWEKRHRVVAVDLRGAGRSPIPDRNWKVEEHVRDIVAVRAALGLERVVVVGCAIGSMVAVPYALADAAAVRGIVLSNTTTELGEASRQRHESRLALVREKGMEALLPGVIDLAFDGLPKDARYRRYLERFRDNDPQGYGALALGMVGTDNTERLGALTCPALVTVGAHDVLLPPPLSRSVHDLLRDSEFVTIDNAAHFAPYQAPEAFAGLVTDFIARRVQTADN